MHTKEKQQAFEKCKMTAHVKKESYKFKAPSHYHWEIFDMCHYVILISF
jgi:hypothetical protein